MSVVREVDGSRIEARSCRRARDRNLAVLRLLLDLRAAKGTAKLLQSARIAFPEWRGASRSRYCMACDDISPDARPFQFVPDSHCWPLIRREKVLKHLPMTDGKDPPWLRH